MKTQKGFIQIPILIIIITGTLIVSGAGYLGINKYKNYQEEKVAKEQEVESQRKLLEETLEAQKLKIDELESSLNETKAKQSNFINKNDLLKQALTTTQIVKSNEKYMVAIACNTKDGISLGSGVIVGKNILGNPLVLTNYHVVQESYSSGTNSPCIVTPSVGFIHDAEPVYFSSVTTIQQMYNEDWAFLEITNITNGGKPNATPQKPMSNLSMSFPRICNPSELKSGSEIVILGYPSIGSNNTSGYTIRNLIATEGIISSSPEDWEDDFAVSAKIDHGSSGGGGFLKTNGCYAGIPTYVIQGKLESLGRLINVPNLNSKLNNFISQLQ